MCPTCEDFAGTAAEVPSEPSCCGGGPGGVNYGTGQGPTVSAGGMGFPGFDGAFNDALGLTGGTMLGTGNGPGWSSSRFPAMTLKRVGVPGFQGKKRNEVIFHYKTGRIFFDEQTDAQGNGNGIYVARHGIRAQLGNSGSGFGLQDAAGNTASYTSNAPNGGWQMTSYTPVGETHSVRYSYSSDDGRLLAIEAFRTVGDHTVHVLLETQTVGASDPCNSAQIGKASLYTWQDASNDYAFGRPAGATLLRSVTYSYYDGYYTEGPQHYGNRGDLRLVQVKDGSGNELSTQYFRYYIPTDVQEGGVTVGYVHGLKYALDEAAYARLLAVGLDPTTAEITDNTLKPYASTFVQYDGSTHKATQVVSQAGGCSSCSGGSGTPEGYRYARTTTPHTPPTGADSWVSWATKTVETLPDKHQNIIYTNALGGVMLKVHRVFADPNNPNNSTYQQWGTYYQYYTTSEADGGGGSGRLKMRVEASGLALPNDLSTLEGSLDEQGNYTLLSSSGGTALLRSATGLVHVYTYYGTAETPAGYLKAEYVQQGQTGSRIKVHEVTYQASEGTTPIYVVSQDQVFTGASVDGTGAQTTSYAYTWNGNQMLSRTISKDAVSADHHGSGNADQTAEYFDALGRVQWTQDEGGYLTYTGYDPITGAVLKQVSDADGSDCLAGDSTPAGGFLRPVESDPHRLHLTTTYTIDSLGRTTSVTDPNNQGPSGRPTYMVYNDANHEVRTYPGWNGSTTLGPVTVSRQDLAGSYQETLTMAPVNLPTIQPVGGGPAVPAGSEGIANLLSLTRSFTNRSGHPVYTDRYSNVEGFMYTTDPVLSSAMEGAHYYRIRYGYDSAGRQNRMRDATGTITRTSYDGLGRPWRTYVGTDDGLINPANLDAWVDETVADTWTESQPGNLIKVSENQYDGGGIGDGNLTQTTQYLDSTGTTRLTQMAYDWRNRLVATKTGGATDAATELTPTHRPLVYQELDNLGRVTARYQYDGDQVPLTTAQPAPEKLQALTRTFYDERGRVYQTSVYSIVPPLSALPAADAPCLSTGVWYDSRGNVQTTSRPGAPWQKKDYDSVGRVTTDYLTDGRDNEQVLEQTSYAYKGTQVVGTVQWARQENTGDGRTQYSLLYRNALGQVTDRVETGTNSFGGALLGSLLSDPAGTPREGIDPPATPPGRSATVLVSSTSYNAAGLPELLTDPQGLVTKKLYDGLGRLTTVIENYSGDGTPTASANRTTTYTYDGADHTLTLTAVLPSSVQETQYVYGVTTTTDSALNSNNLLAQVKYPDKTSGNASNSASDQNVFTYDAQGQTLSKKDQNGTVHSYRYDPVGRLSADVITTLGASITDDLTTVRRIQTSYDAAGRPARLTTFHDAVLGADTQDNSHLLSQVLRQYNGLGQLTAEYQSHDVGKVVDPATTPAVRYTYNALASGVNYSRLTQLTYPNGRAVYYLYTENDGTAGLSDRISRITALGTTSARDNPLIASYDYLGASQIIRKNYPQPGLRLDRGQPDTGYANLDAFGRILNQQWTYYNPQNGSNTTPLFQLQHAYDQNSNRLQAVNTTHPGASQLYTYDNLNRLTSYRAGQLTADQTQLESMGTLASQGWSLDALGNQLAVTQDGRAGYVQHTVNQANQYTQHQVQGSMMALPLIDWFSNAATQGDHGRLGTSDWQTIGPDQNPGSSDHATLNGGGLLTIDQVGQDTFAGQAEEEPRTLVLLDVPLGPTNLLTTLRFPTGSSAGQAGVVFGYRSPNDYWLNVADLSDGYAKTYHVVNGQRTLLHQSSVGPLAAGDWLSWQTTTWSSRHAVSGLNLPDGYPSGRVGIYSNVAGLQFGWFKAYPEAAHVDMAGRWDNYAITNTGDGIFGAIDPATGRLSTVPYAGSRPLYLRGLQLQKFQATFALRAQDWYPNVSGLGFVFNGQDQASYSWVDVSFPWVSASGYQMSDGQPSTAVSGDAPTSVTVPGTSAEWIRVTCDGASVTVQGFNNDGATPAESDWASATVLNHFSGFTGTGGRMGFLPDGVMMADNLTIKSFNEQTQAFDTTEAVESFTTDANGVASNLPAYDANGNLTFDGVQCYKYDAWNRLVGVAHGYRLAGEPASTPPHVGQYRTTMAYDALGRRSVKTLSGTGPASDGTFHFYYSGQQLLETRDASDLVLKQQVWGLSYIDELVQVAVNSDVLTSTHRTCDQLYWVCQDANYNVLGVVDSSGTLQERYEYTPYGQRTVLLSAGANDPGGYSSTNASRRLVSSGVTQPYGLCEFGHQGLYHEEESGLVYNRARMLHPTLGRFLQEDPMGYVDGMSLYQYLQSRPLLRVDPSGKWGEDVHKKKTAEWAVELGFPDAAAAAIGEWDNAVDGTATSYTPGYLPKKFGGDQSYHFNRSADGNDTRLIHSGEHEALALKACREEDDPVKAAKHLGISLHPMQDWIAHADHAAGPGDTNEAHNNQSHYPLYDRGRGMFTWEYPDDPGLDAVGGSHGRANGGAINHLAGGSDDAQYVEGKQRITFTEERTKARLRNFREVLGGFSHPACKCLKYFGMPLPGTP